MFEFVANDTLRNALETDSGELEKCAKAEALKSVHVIAGSIVEAVLVDQLCAVPEAERPPGLGDPLRADLSKLIDAAGQLGILSERTVHLAEVLRSYRNLIHPGRAYRLEDVPTPESAGIAQALVRIVVKEVGRASERLRGLTAEQLTLKLGSDPSASLVLTRLLDEMNKVEIEKLLLTSLPTAYLSAHDDWTRDPEENEILKTCFRRAFERATPQTKNKVCATYVRMIKEDTGYRLASYERAFFRGEYLEFVPDDRDKSLIKERLFGLIRSDPDPAKIPLAGIGKWLTAKESEAVTREVLSLLLYRTDTEEVARTIMGEIYTGEGKRAVADVIEEKIKYFEEHKQEKRVKVLRDLKDGLEGEYYDFEDIPF